MKGQAIVAAVALKEEPPDREALFQYCREHLPDYRAQSDPHSGQHSPGSVGKTSAQSAEGKRILMMGNYAIAEASFRRTDNLKVKESRAILKSSDAGPGMKIKFFSRAEGAQVVVE